MFISYRSIFTILGFFFLSVFNITAQTVVSQLNNQFNVLRQNTTDTKKTQANDSIIIILSHYLAHNDSLITNSHVPSMGSIRSEDDKVTIYTWNYQLLNLNTKYGCIIKYQDKELNNISILIDSQNDIPLRKTLEIDEWYGCLYYKIITKSKRKKTYYTLLGWDANDNIIGRKVIDVLSFSKKGEPELGESIFKLENKTQKRVLFQFSASGSMMLNYDDRYKRIIFDHLSPASPEFEGKYQYYGSDFSYDGFKFYRGKWVFQEMLDPRNED